MQFTSRLSVFVVVCAIALSSCERNSNRSGPTTASDNSTLWTVASKGDTPGVERMLREGAPINGKDKNGKTALHYAAQSKNLELVRFLIKHGADVNATADGNVTPLMLSVDMAFGQPQIALELIRAGADVSAADTNGDTTLLIATTESSDDVFQALLKKGANPNAKGLGGRTALHYAAMNALVDRVKLLLQYGADPTIRDSSGKSAVDVAITTNPDAKVREEFAETKNILLVASRQEAK